MENYTLDAFLAHIYDYNDLYIVFKRKDGEELIWLNYFIGKLWWV